MFKRIIVVAMILCFLSVGLGAKEKDFKKGYWYVSPIIGLNAYALPFGVSVEYALKENIGVGGTLIAYFWSESWLGFKFSYTVINPSVDFYYHLNKYLPVDKLDVFAGASLGYNVFSVSASGMGEYAGELGGGIFLYPFIGARYYIKSNLAIFLRSGFSVIGDLSGFNGVVGVTLILKKK